MIASSTAEALMGELRRCEQLAKQLQEENIRLRIECDELRGAVQFLETQRDEDRKERINGFQPQG